MKRQSLAGKPLECLGAVTRSDFGNATKFLLDNETPNDE